MDRPQKKQPCGSSESRWFTINNVPLAGAAQLTGIPLLFLKWPLHPPAEPPFAPRSQSYGFPPYLVDAAAGVAQDTEAFLVLPLRPLDLHRWYRSLDLSLDRYHHSASTHRSLCPRRSWCSNFRRCGGGETTPDPPISTSVNSPADPGWR